MSSDSGGDTMAEWSNAVAQQPSVKADTAVGDWSRRQLAVLAIVLALIWPFYSYYVQRWLVELEARAALSAAEEQLTRYRRDLAASAANNAAQMREARAEAAARDLRLRIAAVRVVGVIDGSPAVVIVDQLLDEGAATAASTLCAQASIWLRRSVKGETLTVRRDRGNQPVTDAGMVNCP